MNPARARLLKGQEALRTFQWSSYPHYLRAPSKRPGWLRVNRVLGEHGIPKDSVSGRRQLEARMEQRRATEDAEAYRKIRRGWCYGEKAFRQELLDQMEGLAGEHHYAEDRHESDEQKAQTIIATELKRLRWEPEELERRRKGDRRKVRIAQRLREETTMTLKWVAEALQMGAWTNVSNLLSQQRKARRRNQSSKNVNL